MIPPVSKNNTLLMATRFSTKQIGVATGLIAQWISYNTYTGVATPPNKRLPDSSDVFFNNLW